MTYPFLTPLASCHPGIEDTIFKFVSICSLGIAEFAATKPRRYHPARADLATACASASTKVRLASLRTIEKLNKPRTQQALFEPLETKHRRESTFERTSVTETQLQDCQIKCARAEMCVVVRLGRPERRTGRTRLVVRCHTSYNTCFLASVAPRNQHFS